MEGGKRRNCRLKYARFIANHRSRWWKHVKRMGDNHNIKNGWIVVDVSLLGSNAVWICK
jgi:hypothetical protein